MSKCKNEHCCFPECDHVCGYVPMDYNTAASWLSDIKNDIIVHSDLYKTYTYELNRALDMAICALRNIHNKMEEKTNIANHSIVEKLTALLEDPLLVADKNGGLRPINGTTKKSIYEKLLKAQFILGLPYRWFPTEWEEVNQNSDKQYIP